MLRRLHLIVGLAGLVAFLLTGQYMHWAHAHLQGMADGPRLIYRSSHIYLLWASLLNLGYGCYAHRVSGAGATIAQAAGSLALVIGPVMLGWSFFYETYNHDLERPVGRLAIYLALAGTALHVIASFIQKAESESASADRRQ